MTITFYNLPKYLAAVGSNVNDLCTVTNDLESFEFSASNAQKVCQNIIDTTYPFCDVFSLAQALDISPGVLSNPDFIASGIGYKTFYIDKETGKVSRYPIFAKSRRIDAPPPLLKEIQRRLASALTVFPAHPANFAFIQNKSIKDALEVLKDSQTIIHVDLKDFFDSHSEVYLNKKLGKLIYHEESLSDHQWKFIRAITRWVTLKHSLPQGAPTSPILSVVLNYEMDDNLAKAASAQGLSYVRYADDLFFGGTISVDTALDFIESLPEMVQPFRINHSKVGVMTDSVRPIPTGVIIRITPKRIAPSQYAKIFSECRQALGDQTAELLVSDYKLTIKTKILRDNSVADATTLLTPFITWLTTKYPSLNAQCKLRIYHLAKTKAVLGAHIQNGEIKFSRKQYNTMRLHAMLIGMQYAFKYASKILSPALDGLRSVYVVNSVREVAKSCDGLNVFPVAPDINHKRNLLHQPMSYKQYRGKVNWINQIQPEKAAKLKQVEIKFFKSTLRKICELLESTEVIQETLTNSIIEQAVVQYYE